MASLAKKSSRKALLDAATYLLANNPGTSLSEIAQTAGVGRATLHRHFPSRDDLVREIALASLRETNAASANIRIQKANPKATLKEMLEAVIPVGDRYHFLNKEGGRAPDKEVSEGYDAQLKWLERLVKALKANGDIDAGIPSPWAVSVIDMSIWAAWSAIHDGTVARKDAPKLAYRTLLKGLS